MNTDINNNNANKESVTKAALKRKVNNRRQSTFELLGGDLKNKNQNSEHNRSD